MSRVIRESNARLLNAETGAVHKDPGGRLSVCLVYPNTYHVGMSSLGFQGVYNMLNMRPDVVCERAFMPDDKMSAEYKRTKTALSSLESNRPLREFDMIAFSVSFENDYPNIASILNLASIPVMSEDRGDGNPMVVMGGVCAFSNPEPVADIMDAIFMGEAEAMLNEFIDVVIKSKSKAEALDSASKIKGVYAPGFFKPGTRVKKLIAPDISSTLVRHCITTPDTEFSNMRLIEAMRGCPWNCNFCLAGHIYKPVRAKPFDALKSEIESARDENHRVGLIAPSMSDYKYIKDALCIEGVDFSITSLRAGKRSMELMPLLKGHKSVSIAPEAGTDRLRRVVNKNITEEEIIETSAAALDIGIKKLRLYFIIGLPTETDEDVEAVADLVKKIRSRCKTGHISLTISIFVPKPFTPFQWHAMADEGIVKNGLALLKRLIRAVGNTSISHDNIEDAYFQGFMAMADRRASKVIKRIGVEGLKWRKAAKAEGIDPEFYIGRNKTYDEPLPWDFIDGGMDKPGLWRAYEKAMRGDK